MEKLNDYSGEFIPGLKFSDLSHEKAIQLLQLYCQFYMALDGFWYLTIKDKFSNEEALASDLQVWERLSKYEIARITKLLNIDGNDIITLMKILQFTPWQQQTQYTIDIKTPHSAVMTVTSCRTLEALEKEGKGREKDVCQTADPHILQSYASLVNPKIRVKYLKIPPRITRDDICCQWEFILKE